MLDRLWSLLRLLFVWKISDTKPDEVSTNPPHCLIMLAFGQVYERVPLGMLETSRLVPGEPNEAIARVTIQHLRHQLQEGVPILAQWEFLETRYGHDHHQKFSITSLGTRGIYRNTREVLQEAQTIMDANGWKSAVIVAHPWHLARCQWTAQKLGIQVVHDQLLTGELNDFADTWNKQVEVPKDQKQTTSLWRWVLYELFYARPGFWIKGWI